MDIVMRLRDEHNQALSLVQKFDTLDEPVSKTQLLQQIVQVLTVHEEAEETAVWSEIRKILSDTSLVDEAVREEGELKRCIAGMDLNAPVDQLLPKFKQMRDLLMHHISTEQDQVFPLITQKVDAQKREQMADSYMTNKQRLLSGRLTVTMAPEAPVEQRQR